MLLPTASPTDPVEGEDGAAQPALHNRRRHNVFGADARTRVSDRAIRGPSPVEDGPRMTTARRTISARYRPAASAESRRALNSVPGFHSGIRGSCATR